MHGADEVFRGFEIPFHERAVDDELRLVVGELTLTPPFDLLAHRLEVALHPAKSDVDRVRKDEVLGVFGEHGREVAVERHVVAYEDAVAYGQTEAHGFVVGVADSEGIPRAVHSGFEVHHPEELHAVFGDGVFVADDVDVAEGQAFDHLLNEIGVSDGFERVSGFGGQNYPKLFARELVGSGVRH